MTLTANIATLRANVTREEAVRSFADHGSAAWRLIHAVRPLRSVAELYVPFTLFQVTVRHRQTTDTRLLAADRFSGALDPFMFDAPLDRASLVTVASRNRLECSLSVDQVKTSLATKLQRVMFQKGFFKVSGLEIKITPLIEEFYMPYWIGFFGSGTRASLKILDATRRVYEGNKFRSGVEEWLCR